MRQNIMAGSMRWTKAAHFMEAKKQRESTKEKVIRTEPFKGSPLSDQFLQLDPTSSWSIQLGTHQWIYSLMRLVLSRASHLSIEPLAEDQTFNT
jgi:hypothetical protein